MANKLAVLRLKGIMKESARVIRMFELLGLKKTHTVVIISENPSTHGMIKKLEHCITWGEASEELLKKIGEKGYATLKPPVKGFKSLKLMYPRGDLGYRGDKINDLVLKMLK